MILRIDKLAIELPKPANPSPNSASAVQELLGGKFGEMSTLMNYTFQSFNFRGRDKMRPFYDLIANIAAEEYSHIELVAYTINLLLPARPSAAPIPSATPLGPRPTRAISYHFIASGQTALPIDSMGNPWNGDVRLLQRQPQARPAAQLLPGVRRPRQQDPRLRDGRRPDRPRDGRLPAGARRRPHRGLRPGAGEADRRRRRQAPADPGHQQQAVPRGEEARGARGCTGSCSA